VLGLYHPRALTQHARPSSAALSPHPPGGVAA
jgi:hypothetical protein